MYSDSRWEDLNQNQLVQSSELHTFLVIFPPSQQSEDRSQSQSQVWRCGGVEVCQAINRTKEPQLSSETKRGVQEEEY